MIITPPRARAEINRRVPERGVSDIKKIHPVHQILDAGLDDGEGSKEQEADKECGDHKRVPQPMDALPYGTGRR